MDPGTVDRRPVAPPGETRRRVATYLAQGLSPRQIAVLLGISTQVIYYHKYRIEADRKA
jgi:hypothetical protein